MIGKKFGIVLLSNGFSFLTFVLGENQTATVVLVRAVPSKLIEKLVFSSLL